MIFNKHYRYISGTEIAYLKMKYDLKADIDYFIQEQATVPFTSQLVWWLRSFGKKLLHIEPVQVHNAVREIEPDSK